MPLCKILPYFFHGYYILWICLSSLSVSGYEMKWQSLITDLQIQHLPPTREQGESPLPFNYYADSNWTRFWYFSFGMWAFFLTKSLEVFGFLFFYFFHKRCVLTNDMDLIVINLYLITVVVLKLIRWVFLVWRTALKGVIRKVHWQTSSWSYFCVLFVSNGYFHVLFWGKGFEKSESKQIY